jgi:hypothetical protein
MVEGGLWAKYRQEAQRLREEVKRGIREGEGMKQPPLHEKVGGNG